MNEDASAANGNMGLLVLVAVVYFFWSANGGDSLPAPPDPARPAVSELSKEIVAAMRSASSGTCERYAAFYWAAGEYIKGDAGPKGIAARRDVVVNVKDGLGLESSPAFGAIVKRELESFAKGDVDKVAYAVALARLSDACRAAER
jgi:hypothetical protein